jgi:hypothetical protein
MNHGEHFFQYPLERYGGTERNEREKILVVRGPDRQQCISGAASVFSPRPKRVLRRLNREFHHEGTKTRRRAKEEEEALTSSSAGRTADDHGTTTKDIEGNSFSLLPVFFVSSCLKGTLVPLAVRGDIPAAHVGYPCSPWFKGYSGIAQQEKGATHG